MAFHWYDIQDEITSFKSCTDVVKPQKLNVAPFQVPYLKNMFSELGIYGSIIAGSSNGNVLWNTVKGYMSQSKKAGGTTMKPKIWKRRRQQTLDKMSIIKSTGRTPRLDKLNPIQLISLDKLNPIQLIRILISQSLITFIMAKMVKNRTKCFQTKILLKMSENVKLSTNSMQ
ncbi:hypothetical protein GPALN_012341 [Globodera pallida]|nr:hypothetical protein GPALN_012341 [Globodera pallida]